MSHDDKTRRQIGKYTILEQVGEGGCGIVYRALDPELERTVAIKTLSSCESSFRQRFKREAKLVARLDHERIVRVYDAGIEAEEPYLVQEFLNGEDLKQKIVSKEDMPLATKVRILQETADGLGHAHEKGIVHRDIKPGNIRVLENGHVKIMDFGIAKQLQDATQQLTQVGFSVGTAAYLSPEQIDGGEVDRRADIFAFGVVAYELLAQERPFPGETISRLFRQITSEKPEPLASRMPPDTPEQLTALIERCLEKASGNRPQHMSEVAAELESVLAGLDGTRPEPVAAATARATAEATGPPVGHAKVRDRPTSRATLPRWFKPVAVASVAIVILAVGLVILQTLPPAEAEPGWGGETQGQTPAANPATPDSRSIGTTPTGANDRSPVEAPSTRPPAEKPGATAPPAAAKGRGTTVVIPLVDGPAKTTAADAITPPTPAPVAPVGDPAQLILVSDNAQATEHLVPALRRRFASVVIGPDALSGREMHPTAGRTLVVSTTASERTTTSYGTQLASCVVTVSAQLQDAKSFEHIDSVSAESTEPTCGNAIRVAATELAGKLRLR